MERYFVLVARLTLVAVLLITLNAGLLSQTSSNAKSPPKLPYGGVNFPASGQKIKGKVDLVGWALSESGIASVSIYLDRSFVADCSTGQARPDVAKAYPKVNGSGASGWKLTFDSAKFSPDWHELTIQARSRAGATRDLATLPILIAR